DEKLKSVINELLDYFNGNKVNFKPLLDLRTGTIFQRKVWEKISEIPYGELRSYKWIANEICNPDAVRAVGNAVGKNPVPPIIPCHRVIRSDGKLGGFSSGIPLKKWLLKLEQASLPSQ
nr:methylated-DNA--[protein]-cysteine S-methyltransferase [Candidatus Brocadiales bacterium]